jgi:hypothetical protein
MIAEKLQEILNDAQDVKSIVDLQKEEVDKLLIEDSAESAETYNDSSTEFVLSQLESDINISGLTGIQKTRAIQQKIELQNIKGQSLAMTIPEIGDRAVFRSVFQILFQSQRLAELLAAYTLVEAKELQMVVADLSDALMVGVESTRLLEEQKSMIVALCDELNELKLEFQKSSLEQSAEKIKRFEKNLEEKIQLMNQWLEPYFGIFEN